MWGTQAPPSDDSTAVLDALLSHKADHSVTDKVGRVCGRILLLGGPAPTRAPWQRGRSALMLAVEAAHYDAIDQLLKAGAEPELRDDVRALAPARALG